jgi:hypothetical protein
MLLWIVRQPEKIILILVVFFLFLCALLSISFRGLKTSIGTHIRRIESSQTRVSVGRTVVLRNSTVRDVILTNIEGGCASISF